MTDQTQPEPPRSPPSSGRDALDRRIWRLSFLITGNELAAAELVDRVRRAHELRGMDPARMDRLIIQQARELLGTNAGYRRTMGRRPPASAVIRQAEPQVQRAFETVQSLAEQPREAWVLARIDQLDDLHVSRAMDCSKTATHNHLAAADNNVRAALAGEYDRAVASLRAFADGLDPGPILSMARAHRQQQRIRRAGMIAIGIATVALLALLAWLKLG